MTGRVNRRSFPQRSAVGAGAGVVVAAVPGAAGAAAEEVTDGGGRIRVKRLPAEYADSLPGTDVAQPQLEWMLLADGLRARQSAYRIEAASEARLPHTQEQVDARRCGRVTDTEQSGRCEPGFDDSGRRPATVLAPYGRELWSTGVTVGSPEAQTPLLRPESGHGHRGLRSTAA